MKPSTANMHNPPTMDENNAPCRPPCESLIERQMHATDMSILFSQSVSSLDTIFEATRHSSKDTIFESTAESTRIYFDFGTAARNFSDGVSGAYDRCCHHRNLKQECCCEQDSSSTTRHNKQRRHKSPMSRRRRGADSHRPNSPTASRMTSGRRRSTSSISSNQQDRWQSVVRASAVTTRVPTLVGTRLISPKKEGIKSVSLTVKALPREEEMKKCEEGPPSIEKLLEQKWDREQQEEMDLLLAGPGEPIHISTVAARGA